MLTLRMTDVCYLSEPHSVQPQDDSQPCEHEWRSSVELLPQVKEEPKQGNLPTEIRDLEEGNCSHVDALQRPHAPPAESAGTLLASQGIKGESGREDCGKRQVSSSLQSPPAVRPNHRGAQSDAAKMHRTQRAEQQTKGLLRSSGKQSTHILQIKNVRSLKLPPPRSTHPSQSIQRWHSCKECGKGFSFACQLEVHMRWHTKEKPYSCAVCRKSFTTVSMLKRHHRIHTGEKPFHCHVCGKCFNQSAHLNTHFRLHTRERASWSRAAHAK